MRSVTLICLICFLLVMESAQSAPLISDPKGQTIMRDPALQQLVRWPQTVHVDAQATALSLPTLRLVGRMSEGIFKNWVETRNQGMWFECGLRYETCEERKEAATQWAYHIARSASEHDINPWGLAGTIANESNFDRCAIGYHPRKWAIRRQLLRPKRRTISYSAREVLAVYRSIAAKRRWSQTGWDAGPCQLLTKFYPGDIEDMLTLTRGLDICAMEMHARSEMYNTRRGWRWWRGTEAEWYDRRVTRYARKIGARPDEI